MTGPLGPGSSDPPAKAATPARAWVAPVLFAALLASACTAEVFTDTQTMAPTTPPEPRNACEEGFSSHLTNGLGLPAAAPPTPLPDTVLLVMGACTAEELMEADDYFAYVVGGPMSYLTHRRLFNGADRAQQLATLCDANPYAPTRTCRTLDRGS